MIENEIDMTIDELQDKWLNDYKLKIPEETRLSIESSVDVFLTSRNANNDAGMEWHLWMILYQAYQSGVINELLSKGKIK